MHLLIQVIVTLVVVGVILWALEQLPIEATYKVFIRVIAIVATVIWLASLLLHWPAWR